MLQIVTWLSSAKLSCGGCNTSEVILCIKNPTLVAKRVCPTSDLLDPDSLKDSYQRSTIPAMLLTSAGFKDECGSIFYKYQFQYDDCFLVVNAKLSAGDIDGVLCTGCLTRWITDMVGNDVVVDRIAATEAVPQHLVLTNEHGCKFNFYEGFGEVTVSEDDECDSPGVGPTKTVRGVTVDAGVLTIDAAPMPIWIGEVFADTDNTPVEIDQGFTGTVTLGTFGPFSIENPSDCVEANLHLLTVASIFSSAWPAGFAGIFTLTFTGDYTDVMNLAWSNPAADAFYGNLPRLPWNDVLTIAAGATVSFNVVLSLTVNATGDDDITIVGFAHRTTINGATIAD